MTAELPAQLVQSNEGYVPYQCVLHYHQLDIELLWPSPLEGRNPTSYLETRSSWEGLQGGRALWSGSCTKTLRSRSNLYRLKAAYIGSANS